MCLIGWVHANELDQATLKILYTYKFGKFSKWPDQKLNTHTQAFHICILGKNQFPQKTLNLINGKLVQGIPISIDLFTSGLIPKALLPKCHVLFVSQSEKHRLNTILAVLNKEPILTVSDIDGFSVKGGMITLVEEQNKVHFQINPTALQQSNLTISSKIMELAEIINRGP